MRRMDVIKEVTDEIDCFDDKATNQTSPQFGEDVAFDYFKDVYSSGSGTKTPSPWPSSLVPSWNLPLIFSGWA